MTVTAALDDDAEQRHIPARLQVPIDSEFREQYLQFAENADADGVPYSDGMKALVELFNANPDLQQQVRELSRRRRAQRRQAANRARAESVRRSWNDET